ncbi:hypothetical protein SPHINGOAX6_70832 [Sphingomonas sp. AX6]|nr:hypothetical protein SPHINGOAX6_70832 [Sphingomonas sp. AX6]
MIGLTTFERSCADVEGVMAVYRHEDVIPVSEPLCFLPYKSSQTIP